MARRLSFSLFAFVSLIVSCSSDSESQDPDDSIFGGRDGSDNVVPCREGECEAQLNLSVWSLEGADEFSFAASDRNLGPIAYVWL
jgi:hypothetical protein